MEHESNQGFRPEMKQDLPEGFLGRWGRYNPREVAFMAAMNGISVFGLTSAVEDFGSGLIGHGIVKAVLTLGFPISSSILSGIAMFEKS